MEYLIYGLGGLTTLGAALAGIWSMGLRRVVPTNMVHIVQYRNNSVAYGRGKDAGNTYYEWPSWVPGIGVTVTTFPESIFQIDLQDYDAYDSARLPFQVDVTAFFRVHDAGTVAQRVATFHELETQLRSVLQGAVRRILATNTLEEIMQERASLGSQFTAEVTAQIQEWGVQPVKAIEFMDLRDSSKGKVIEAIMAKEKSRIEQESRSAIAENTRIAEMREIEARRQIDTQREEAEATVGRARADRERTVGLESQEARRAILEATQASNRLEAEAERIRRTMEAETASAVAETAAKQAANTAIVDAEAKGRIRLGLADLEQQEAIRRAEAQRVSAEAEATRIRVTGEAAAAAELAKLSAPVEAQIRLANEIGNNKEYQTYLLSVRRLEAEERIGIENARALANADIKIISTGSDAHDGLNKASSALSPAAGARAGAALDALVSSSTVGKALLQVVAPDNEK